MSVPFVLFDSTRELEPAICKQWGLSPSQFRAVVQSRHTSLPVFVDMLYRMTGTSPTARLLVATEVVCAAAELACIAPDSFVDDGTNAAVVKGIRAEIAARGRNYWTGCVTHVPDWRLAIEAARAAMEGRARAAPQEATSIRDEFERGLAAQRRAEAERHRELRLLAVAKAHALLDTVVGDQATQICVASAMRATVPLSWTMDAKQWPGSVRCWISGMRELFGPTLARCSRSLLPRLRVTEFLEAYSPDYEYTKMHADTRAVVQWFRSHTPLVYRSFGNSERTRYDVTSALWDAELQRAGEASNATALLLRGEQPLNADVVHAIATMLDPCAMHAEDATA